MKEIPYSQILLSARSSLADWFMQGGCGTTRRIASIPVAKTPHHTLECFHPKRVLVQTRNQLEVRPAGLKKRLPATHPDFLDGFQAIRNEGRANHQHTFDASRG